MPFLRLDRDDEAQITLRVITPTSFVVVEGFRYVDRYANDTTYEVPAGTTTDLASVPFFLQWLVRSYGRHTNAAILHDYLWSRSTAELRLANTVFRHAMWETCVPFVRRWFMWAAVTLGMLTRSRLGRLQLTVWGVGLVVGATAAAVGAGVPPSASVAVRTAGASFVVALVATVAVPYSATEQVARLFRIGAACAGGVTGIALVVAVTVRHPVTRDHGYAVAVLAVVVAVTAWGRSIRAALIATPAVVLLVPPLLGVAIGLLTYGVVEGVALVVIPVLRSVKARLGGSVVGTVNPITTDVLQVTASEPGTSYAASQA